MQINHSKPEPKGSSFLDTEFVSKLSKNDSALDTNKIRCDICGKFFLRSSLLQHKYQKHPQNNKVGCDICGKMIFKFQIQAHKIQAHKIKPVCKICGKELHPGSLKRHMVSQHSMDEARSKMKHKCLLCGIEVLPANLQQHNDYLHKSIPLNQRQFLRVSCDVCS